MTASSHPNIYDAIGTDYPTQRVEDPRIAAMIRTALGHCQTVCNVGAGAGSYEPADLDVTAIEPSQKMIDQRINSFPVIQATAEALPLANDSFDASMAILTIHHWLDPVRGLLEMQRISQRQVIFTFDPEMIDSFWLVRDYFPEIIEFEKKRTVPISVLTDNLKVTSIQNVQIPWDCMDGFQAAYWRRPEYYLHRDIRQSISTFAQLPESLVERGIKKLSADLACGAWQKRYSDLLDCSEMDFGYRLITAEKPV